MTKIINYNFKKFNSFNSKELKAANTVVKSGKLSEFLAGELEGGKQVQKFEKSIKKYFNIKYAITLNSWTSGLIAAVGALDIEPGDEIIVSPWTMCATATAIVHWNCIPVFVDIEADTFCIDPKKIEAKITVRTKAIIAVDIFGQSSDILKIKKIAKKYSLKVITDSAQSPGAKIKNFFVGTLGDIGGFSLNYHKHIHTGEGGIIVTNDAKLAKRVKLIRNHGEAYKNLLKNERNNIIGHNFRLGEIESAIGIQQLKKLKEITNKKKNDAKILSNYLGNLPGLILPKIRKDCTHVYYVYPIIIDEKKIKIKRKKIVESLKREGMQGISEGYCLLNELPMFKHKIAYGKKGFPWNITKNNVNYKENNLEIASKLHNKTFISFEICLFDLTKNDLKNIQNCFKKVWKKYKII